MALEFCIHIINVLFVVEIQKNIEELKILRVLKNCFVFPLQNVALIGKERFLKLRLISLRFPIFHLATVRT